MGESGVGRPAVTPARRWAQLHHGIDPGRVPLLLPWLRLMWRLAAPLAARRVPPTAVTLAGGCLAAAAVALAGAAPAAALVLVLLAAVCDGLDGALAVVADRVSRAGARADAVVDRTVDVAFAAVLWRCGVWWPAAAVAGLLAVAVDLVRRLVRAPARITVGERPSWTICAALACASSAITDAHWPVLCCAGVWLALGVVAVAQLLAEVALRARGRP
jgi:CDP-diacylglycerol--glycerol-3-phosphate 3-phosphatidyltransferase